MSLSYSPVLVVWTGIASVATWSAGVFWVAGLPESITHRSQEILTQSPTGAALMERYLDPNAVSLTTWTNQMVFLVLVTTILALAVWRSRRLVRLQAAAESERTALSRYFSPNIVRELSRSDGVLDRPSIQPGAVLFADMVGFAAISEKLTPDALIELLRDFHGRLARVAFAHDGTVDKYIGDAIMVHFGTPRPQIDDPVRALSCAAAMLEEIRRWNDERKSRGQEPIAIGIGVHYGELLVGNIGDARRLEYTVLGDTVNVASRLEGLTREIGGVLAVSDDLIQAVRTRGVDPESLLDGLRYDPARSVRGRLAPVAIWYLPDPNANRPASPNGPADRNER